MQKAKAATKRKTANDWKRESMAPKRNATPKMIGQTAYYLRSQVEPVTSRTHAKEMGLKVPDDATPLAVWTYRGPRTIEYEVFAICDCVPLRKVEPIEAKPVDVLLAIWTVSRTAKRYRDQKNRSYALGHHGRCAMSKEEEQHLYDLKENGIRYAYSVGRLRYEGIHAGLALYIGEGFSFHSRLMPQGETYIDDGERLQVASKAKTRKEAKLKDAKLTLESLPSIQGCMLVEIPTEHETKQLSVHGWDDGDDQDGCEFV